MSEDRINARKARYLLTQAMYMNRVIDIVIAKDCLKGKLNPGDNSTFVDDSKLPLENTVQAMTIIEITDGYLP